MRNLTTLCFFLILSFSFAQNFDEQWKEVYKFELDGKIQSAQKEVQEIYRNAKKKKDEIQIIKCFFYLSKFELVFDEKAQSSIISNLKNEIKEAQPASKALLNYIYAAILQNYFNHNSYTISRRTDLNLQRSEDFLTWSSADFLSEIEIAYINSLKNEKELRKIQIVSYKEIFEVPSSTDAKNYSLYDFLVDKYLNFYTSNFKYWVNDNKINQSNLLKTLYKNTDEFINLKFDFLEDEKIKLFLNTIQNNEKYYLGVNPSKADLAYYERLNLIYQNYKNEDLYINNLKALEKNTKNNYLKQQIKVDRIKIYYNETNKYNAKNYYLEALKLIDTVLNNKINNNALADAENIKNLILKKSLNVKFKNIIYPDENTRAFIEYKNIDSIKISYYRFPVKNNEWLNFDRYDNTSRLFNTDSLVIDFIDRNIPIKTQSIKLRSEKDYFLNSTEIVLEKLDVGNYLLFIETSNGDSSDNKAYTFGSIQTTNFTLIEDSDNNNNLFYVLNRKTGEPLPDIFIKNEEEIVKTNSKGKAFIKKSIYDSKKKFTNELLVFKEKDTLSQKYIRSFLYDNEEDYEEDYENFEAKAMIYFDRAIYFPGQKMHYKGVLIQNKDNIKSVVSFVSVHVEISDVNGNTLKEFDIQTNEFGSFSGEFDIPKNVLTGEFTITIAEPDDDKVDIEFYNKIEKEHKFWDYVDFNEESFSFKVEEYKRPTFEVKFNEIKENYTIGDTLKITGYAKSLAGNNITNAKVAFTVSKHVSVDDRYYNRNNNFIKDQTTTDEKGNFSIEIPFTEDGIANENITLITYTINVEVTDVQGETRSANKHAKVGQKMLELELIVNDYLIKEDENYLTIKSTTLNNFPIDAKGEIKIYEFQKKSYLKSRQFGYPGSNTISRSQFEKLFPHEPYSYSDNETKEVLVKTVQFDTKISKKILLDFLKKCNNGRYKAEISAYDSQNNFITSKENFQLKSRINILSDNELFNFKDISKPKSDYIEIEVQSKIPSLFISSRLYGNVKKLEDEQVIELKNGKGTLKFLKKSSYQNDIYFHFSTIWENQSEEKRYTIQKEYVETKLNFEIVSLRNKIEPGSIENWSFKMKDQKMESEVLASMYDISLDQFNQLSWSDITFYNFSTPSFPKYSIESISSKSISNFYFDRNYFKTVSKNPEIYWYGFNFNGPNEHITKKYLDRIKPISETPKKAKIISGLVTEGTLPLPGATIRVKGTSRGTSTDFDGFFSIEAVKGEVLIIEYLGLKTEEITVGNQREFIIQLESDSSLLMGVELVGEGYNRTKTKASTTSAITIVSSETYESTTNESFLKSILGSSPGLSIVSSSGTPGSYKMNISIRGSSSLNKNPLYIIDGVLFEKGSLDINSEDIETVSVLRDESATALYGSRGANGVIVITTKNAIQALNQVKTRTNFNETAFFYPHLKTDSDGKFSFNFRNPESLTSWKLRLYGHNKKAESGYFESTIISQKDVMVQTNMPRFVREKDTISISAKVVNMTNETKSGIAMLLLFDATNRIAIDSITLNTNNTRNFDCKPKESVPVTWKITIPEGLQGLQYKIVAKSGNFSDGEENILPVLSNKILITESIPIWVKGNSKKEYVFENLKNNSSETLKSHQFTLEYTSNPTWLALQSLPYLMEFQHECAEQTFSRYYGNFIATEIINSNPKIATLFESWKNNPTSIPKLNKNEELKSIILNETPWLLDAESEELKNKRLALLIDLNTMKESQESTFKKLEEKQLPSGAFPWFDGGDENMFITQHIVAGLGHLGKLFPESNSKFEKITSKAIPNLDNHFIKNSTLKNERINYYTYSNLHYLYARSFYIEKMPVSKKIDSIITIQKIEFKANWLQYSLYKKALLALTMHRFGDKKFAEKIITNLKETVARNDDYGMYWVENKNGYYWYQSAIETQALLIEAFAEIEKDKKYIDEMKVWLLKQKQLQNWPTTKATTEAVYALLLQGSDWTNSIDNTKFKIGNEKILTKKLSEKDKEAKTGYIKMNWNADEIIKEMGSISVENKSSVAGFGGLYWQYFENLENIKSDSTAVLSITKNLYKKVKSSDGDKLLELNKEIVKPGDLITIRLILKTENDLEFVHLKDLRASSFEPIDVISKYEWKDGLRFYRSTKDVATHFFFDTIKKGTYVLEYDVRINHSGSFVDGISTLQSMYAPEFSAHSISTKVKIE